MTTHPVPARSLTVPLVSVVVLQFSNRLRLAPVVDRSIVLLETGGEPSGGPGGGPA